MARKEMTTNDAASAAPLQDVGWSISQGDGIMFSSPLCPSFCIGPLQPSLVVDENPLHFNEVHAGDELSWDFGPIKIQMRQKFEFLDNGALRLKSEITNHSDRAVVLNRVRLLSGSDELQTEYSLGAKSGLRFYEQSTHSARVRQGGRASSMSAVAEDPTQKGSEGGSQLCWVSYAPHASFAWLAGFETAARWDGHIYTAESAAGELQKWEIGFDGGDLQLDPGHTVALEDVLFLAGEEPYALLERYGDLVQQRHNLQVLSRSPVSWCSWYPFRLGVTHSRVLANARVAAQRLQPLGLEIIEVDLGWEKEYLPSCYAENAQFPHGLAGLSTQLRQLGFKLGIWQGIFLISEFDEVARQHPEWLLGTSQEQPAALGTWFWIPHGAYYALDLTHPGAQEWLRGRIRSLAERGAEYFKFDFASVIISAALRHRHDPRIVAGANLEIARIGMRIVDEEIRKYCASPLVLNCGIPDLPGPHPFNLLYTCQDTGNTGYSGFRFLRDCYGNNVAGHLWKQGSWGTIQPSCLCVGLPGTMEEARLRATATFMAGGQVDISDDLTSLPEDRWQVLTATLPPLGKAARPVDLFDPISCSSLHYEALCRGEADAEETLEAAREYSRVWHLAVAAAWDEWQLVALFDYDAPQPDETSSGDLITRYQVPLKYCGLAADENYWAFEFWSGHFLGVIPRQAEESLAPKDYSHPGDVRTLITNYGPDALEIAFFGPAVKLLSFRKARPHPWVVGTSFHQSCGMELQDVTWQPDGEGGILRGTLHRPAGQHGDIFIAGAGQSPVRALVDGREAFWRYAANGSIAVGASTQAPITSWEMHWTKGEKE